MSGVDSVPPSGTVTNEPLARVLDLIIRGEATTRPELVAASGLGRTVVVQRVEQALDAGLIEDGGPAPSTGGRSARELRFRADAGRILVSVFGAHSVELGVTDLRGRVLRARSASWEIKEGPELSMRFAADQFGDLIHEVGEEVPVWAAAVGVPGPVEFATGRPVSPPAMPGWDGYDIRGWIHRQFNLPVWVDNDSNLMAIGEHVHGAATARDMLFLKVGTGIGAGIIAGGDIQRGARGAAGDIGHISVSDAVEVCRCGQHGCLETTAAGWALLRDAEEAAERGASPWLMGRGAGLLRITDIAEGADRGDAVCVQLLARSAGAVGEAAASLINVLNPEVVAIGGSLGLSGERFLSVVREYVYRRSTPLATRDLRVVLSSLGSRQGIVGGAALASMSLLRPKSLQRWAAHGRPAAVDRQLLYDMSDR